MNMKTQFIALSLCLLAFCSVVEAKVSSRKSSNFNREWKYMRGDHQGAEQILSAYLILCRKTFMQAMVGIVNL